MSNSVHQEELELLRVAAELSAADGADAVVIAAAVADWVCAKRDADAQLAAATHSHAAIVTTLEAANAALADDVRRLQTALDTEIVARQDDLQRLERFVCPYVPRCNRRI